MVASRGKKGQREFFTLAAPTQRRRGKSRPAIPAAALDARAALEGGVQLLSFDLLDVNFVDSRRRRTAARPADELGHTGVFTLYQRFHAAVPAISYPTGHAAALGLAAQGVAEPNPLYPAADPKHFRNHAKNLNEVLQPTERKSKVHDKLRAGFGT
jgi:hypothetical protein